ncbi:MAG: hypothetical protein COA82_03520 [Alkaliphilus sp.]|nr:MAG: hypothetical protein COA82_03520 [Alkaliphilus sp.]
MTQKHYTLGYEVKKEDIIDDETFLLFTIQHFNSTNRGTASNSKNVIPQVILPCSYEAGCAIGIHMTIENRIKADDLGDDIVALVENYPELFPPVILERSHAMLLGMQSLHDNLNNFDEKGLSEEGRKHILAMLTRHNLRIMADEIYNFRFQACKYLDFKPSYANCKRQAVSNGKLFWLRMNQPAGNPTMVQFCSKRGRLNTGGACLHEAAKLCSSYEQVEHIINVPKDEID